MDIDTKRPNLNLKTDSFSKSDLGNLGALFILGYIVGSGRWKMLAGPGSRFISTLGSMAVSHALESLKSQDLFSTPHGIQGKGSDQFTPGQSSQSSIPQSSIKPARSVY
jgi:hypothetical protein